MDSRHKNIVYVVASNDLSWAKSAVQGVNVAYIEDSRPEISLAVMSLMNHLIISVGTFSWWIAYLSSAQDVVYYNKTPQAGSFYDVTFRAEDYWLPHWVGLSWCFPSAVIVFSLQCSLHAIKNRTRQAENAQLFLDRALDLFLKLLGSEMTLHSKPPTPTSDPQSALNSFQMTKCRKLRIRHSESSWEFRRMALLGGSFEFYGTGYTDTGHRVHWAWGATGNAGNGVLIGECSLL